MSRVAPKADVADVLFADWQPRMGGIHCVACNDAALREAIENTLRGMLGEGPWAGRVPLQIGAVEIHRRLSNPERAKAAGLPIYPRKRAAFEQHVKGHRPCSELWERVTKAKQAAGIS